MTHLKPILYILVVPLSLAAADAFWYSSLSSRVGRGTQLTLPYNYTENFLSGIYQNGPWYVNMRIELSPEPEYGHKMMGLENAFMRYSHNMFSLEFGHITALFGSGIGLNLYKDQSIDFDNQVLGMRVESTLGKQLQFDFVAGVKENYEFYASGSDLRLPNGQLDYGLLGAALSFNTEHGVRNSTPYLILSQTVADYAAYELNNNSGTIEQDTLRQIQNAVQAGWFQSVYGETWGFNIEYTHTWRAFDFPLLSQSISQSSSETLLFNKDAVYESQGKSLDLQLDWFPNWAVLSFDYRLYLNGIEAPEDKRDPLLMASKPLPWQLGPTGLRQHDISLLANVTHAVDYGDELGWSFEARPNLTDLWSLALSAAQVSQAVDVRDIDAQPGFIPSLDVAKNPWQEYYLELEYAGNELSQRMLIAYTRSTLSGTNAAEITSHYTFMPAYLYWYYRPDLVFSTVIELQHSEVNGITYEQEKFEGHAYNSYHFLESIDFLGKYSVSLIWDASNDPNITSGQGNWEHWISGDISLKPLEGLWLRAAYGREKGGIRCTGGVCRIINPFEGLRFTLEWRL